MELKEVMYVRTKEGKIFDCYASEQMGKPIYYPKSSKTNGYIDYEEVYKKSKCIIGLIEVGDYVNGYRVTYVYPSLIKVDSTDIWEIHPHDIKSIVTKEQFNSVKYEVE